MPVSLCEHGKIFKSRCKILSTRGFKKNLFSEFFINGFFINNSVEIILYIYPWRKSLNWLFFIRFEHCGVSYTKWVQIKNGQIFKTNFYHRNLVILGLYPQLQRDFKLFENTGHFFKFCCVSFVCVYMCSHDPIDNW